MDALRVSIPVATTAPGGTTNAYVVGRDPGVLVDPADRSEALTQAVRDRDVEHVLATHAHPDHVGGVAAYAADTAATVWARAGHADRLADAAEVTVDRTFREGTRIGPVRVHETPGHAADHVALAAGDEALVGDLAMRDGSVYVGGPTADMRAYLTSLRRLLARGFQRLGPGHGPRIDDPDAVLTRLIRHRLDRERRVRAAVDAGASTPDAIVDAAYDRDLGDLRGLARRSVITHLEKLAVEGDVRWDGERARPVG